MKTYPASTLCMVGPDKDGSQEKCRDLVRSVNLTGSLLFTGKLSKEDWWELSGQYDIFLNTSTIDNTPVSVIEAMALGLPVVSTDVGGMRYLIEQGSDGILVESGDVDAMVLAICDLVEGRINGASLALKARAKVEKMDLAVVVSEWCKILEVDT
jgi:glycosyltransferase involved in cell wall biosynthesis